MDRIVNDRMTLEFKREDMVDGWRVYMLDDHPLAGIVDDRKEVLWLTGIVSIAVLG